MFTIIKNMFNGVVAGAVKAFETTYAVVSEVWKEHKVMIAVLVLLTFIGLVCNFAFTLAVLAMIFIMVVLVAVIYAIIAMITNARVAYKVANGKTRAAALREVIMENRKVASFLEVIAALVRLVTAILDAFANGNRRDSTVKPQKMAQAK